MEEKLILLFIGVIVGALPSLTLLVIKSRIEDKYRLIELKRVAYQRYLKASEYYTNKRTADIQKELSQARQELLLVGSDDVIELVGKRSLMDARYIEASAKDEIETHSKIILAMRKDCFGKSKLNSRELSNLSGLITKDELKNLKEKIQKTKT